MTAKILEFKRARDRETDDAELLNPLLGEIARMWRRIHPFDLTAQEVLWLLALLSEITDRLDSGEGETE